MADAKIRVVLDLEHARAQMRAAGGGGGAGADGGAAGGGAGAEEWLPNPSLYGSEIIDEPPKSAPRARKSRWNIRGARQRARSERSRRMRKKKRLNYSYTQMQFMGSQRQANLGMGGGMRRRSLFHRYGRPQQQTGFAKLMRGKRRMMHAVGGVRGIVKPFLKGGAIFGTAAASYAAVDQGRNIIPVIEEVARAMLPDSIKKLIPDWFKSDNGTNNLQNIRAGISAISGSIGTGASVIRAMAITGQSMSKSGARGMANSIWSVQYAKARGKLDFQEASIRDITRGSIGMLKDVLREQFGKS